MITMKDVAKEAGVSMITVSRMINSPNLVKESTRIKVEAAMKKLNFKPNYAAKALAENSTRVIHLYIPKYINISDPFIMPLIAGVSEKLSDSGYLFSIQRQLEFNRPCDGVIVTGLSLSEEKIIKDKLEVPFVLFGKADLDIDCIDVDNVKGEFLITEYMIKCGHKRIGFIGIETDLRYANERFEGYKQALSSYNIEFDEKLVRYSKDFSKDGYALSLELLKQEKPSGILCCNDLLGIGAFRAAENLGLKVPKDISIGGFDGLVYDLVTEKPLTTVRQPVFQVGKKLAERLLNRISNPEIPNEKILVDPELIIRKTINKK